jgi:DUF4097 and DUF4098 domain-containing protein YvlB
MHHTIVLPRAGQPVLAALWTLTLVLFPPQLYGQTVHEDWCRDAGRSQHCELRQQTFAMSGGELVIDVGGNGTVEVESHPGNEVRVTARVTARARNASAARELAGQVKLQAAPGQVRATGPRSAATSSWSVSVRVLVPAGVAINARTTNGSIRIQGTGAPVVLRTTNGNITAHDVGGRLEARTTNGSVRASLAAGETPLEGVLIRTTNGSVQLALPGGVGAALQLSTTNGSITTDMPVTVQGTVTRRQLSGFIGEGGPEIRLGTSNGSIRVSSR